MARWTSIGVKGSLIGALLLLGAFGCAGDSSAGQVKSDTGVASGDDAGRDDGDDTSGDDRPDGDNPNDADSPDDGGDGTPGDAGDGDADGPQDAERPDDAGDPDEPDADEPDAERPDDASAPDMDADVEDTGQDVGPEPCQAPTTHEGLPLATLNACGVLSYGRYANRGQDQALNQVPDFSHAGYKGGGVAIPDVPVVMTLDPPQGDARATIQGALDELARRRTDDRGFRGALLLRRGRWSVGNTLFIRASGIVLRGEGQGTDGTRLIATRRAQHDLIVVEGDGSGLGEVRGTRRDITDAYVGVGARSFAVASTDGFSVGDTIGVERTPNARWIETLGMDRWGWTPSSYAIAHERRITAIDANTITVDIPLVDTMEARFGGGAIFKADLSGRLARVGVEDLRLISEFSGATDEDHGWTAVRLSQTRDSWVRRVSAEHFGYSTVSITDQSSFNTIEECAFLNPVSVVTGSRRYAFYVAGGVGNLFQRCYSQEARHDFVSGARTTGPNVWLDCYSTRSSNDDGPHHRWSTGLLLDNVHSLYLHVENRGSSGSGHGWSGAQTLFWNGVARGVRCDAPLGAMNWTVGTCGQEQDGQWVPAEPPGWWESPGEPVEPRSLYLQQLQDRLGAEAVGRVTTPAQRQGRIWGQLARWAGEGRLADATPSGGDPTCAGGVARGNACCAASCGECGGSGCSGRPGGSSACCSGTIRESGRSCAVTEAPCILDPDFAPIGQP